MLPFCGYNMSSYFQHWLNLGQKLEQSGATLPHIFCVNWFQTDDNGKFIWPGFGENMRVLKWMLERIDGTAQGAENLFGVSPRFEDITWDGLAFDAAQFKRITSIVQDQWRRELDLHEELFTKLQQRLPKALADIRERLDSQVA